MSNGELLTSENALHLKSMNMKESVIFEFWNVENWVNGYLDEFMFEYFNDWCDKISQKSNEQIYQISRCSQ